MGYALRRMWLPQRVASLLWNQWQVLRGIGGNFRMERVATFARNTHPIAETDIHAHHAEAFWRALRRQWAPCRSKTKTYATATTGWQRLLRGYGVVPHCLRGHCTTRAVPAVALGILERRLSVQDMFQIQMAEAMISKGKTVPMKLNQCPDSQTLEKATLRQNRKSVRSTWGMRRMICASRACTLSGRSSPSSIGTINSPCSMRIPSRRSSTRSTRGSRSFNSCARSRKRVAPVGSRASCWQMSSRSVGHVDLGMRKVSGSVYRRLFGR